MNSALISINIFKQAFWWHNETLNSFTEYSYKNHICLPHISVHNLALIPFYITIERLPDSKVHGANIGPSCVLSAPVGPHVYPVHVFIRAGIA